MGSKTRRHLTELIRRRELGWEMQPISKMRFDALAGYSRSPVTVLTADELGWFEDGGERVLGILIRDRIDGDFSSVVLARDKRRRYRAIDVPTFTDSLDEAREDLGTRMARWATCSDTEYYQGDEVGRPLDFFAPLVPHDRLHPLFLALTTAEGYSPARDLISVMMHYYEDPDGNFVEQFQTTAFDARVWELYLFAAFTELMYAFDRSNAAPDFLCHGLAGEFFAEAVTANPTLRDGREVPPPEPETQEEVVQYLREYLPMKWGSALYAKLQKRYWLLPHVGDRPIIFAIQDFHRTGSMSWSHTALAEYLYGVRHDWHHDEHGKLVITGRPIGRHCWGGKEIPSGFFFLPEAEHISAVLANPHGTLTKFNRIGFMAGFGSRRVTMIRTGTRYNAEPNADRPLEFEQRVGDPEYHETWAEGISIFHNPRATHPLAPEFFRGVANHFFEGERIVSYLPPFHPYGSKTAILVPE